MMAKGERFYFCCLARYLLAIAALFASVAAYGATFSDNFNRPDGPVGNGWKTNPDCAALRILSGRAVANDPSSWCAGIYRAIDTTQLFTVTATITGVGGLNWAFNFYGDGTFRSGVQIFVHANVNPATGMVQNLVQIQQKADPTTNGGLINVLSQTWMPATNAVTLTFVVDPVLGRIDGVWPGGVPFGAAYDKSLLLNPTKNVLFGTSSSASPPTLDNVSITYTPSPPPLARPSSCTLTATPTSLPAGGGNVTLAGNCATGGTPTSFSWSGGFATGRITSGNTISGRVTATTPFTLIASNAGGSSGPASVTVSVADAPPPPVSSAKPTTEQLERFSAASYGSTTPVAGYSEIPLAFSAPGSGFGAKAFRNIAGDRIVLAIAGTDDPLDYMGADPSFLRSQPTDTLKRYVGYATTVVQVLATRFPGIEITFTGHSLGGALAQIIANATGSNATTFNAPGAAQFVPYFQTGLSSLPTLPKPSGRQEITNYRVYGDLVSSVGTQFGTTITFTPPISTILIDALPLEYAKAMHILSTVLERIVNNAPTTTSFGPTAASASVGLLATGYLFGGVTAFIRTVVTATVAYFIDPEGFDTYIVAGDPGSPRFRSVTFPFLLNTDAVFRLESLVGGIWTQGGIFEERAAYDFGPLGVDQFRFSVLERDSLRAPTSVEPFTYGVTFVSDGVFSGTMAARTSRNNYQGLWWNAPAASESGWGINVAHQDEVIFVTWFTYDATGKAWWLSMTATQTAENVYSGSLVETRGPAFNAVPFPPSAVTRNVVGSGTLTFSDTDNGSFAYTVNGVSQTKVITRQVFGALPICMWGGQPHLSRSTNFQDLWYAAPEESESGWGVNVTHQDDVIFATWFTYDAEGKPLWLSATATKTAPGAYTGTLYRTTGPAFSATPFSPDLVQRTPIGTTTLTFTNGNAGSFSYQIADGANVANQTKAITRQVFRTPGTICQ